MEVAYATNENMFLQMEAACAALEATHARMNDVLRSGKRLLMVKAVKRVADPVLLNLYCQDTMDELGVLLALVTLLDAENQEILAAAGPSLTPEVIEQTGDASQSLCQFVLASASPVQIDNISTFCPTTPGVSGLAATGAHSYYGEPIAVYGEVVGSFCVLDHPREWSQQDREVAHRVARFIETDLESRIDLGDIDG